MNTDYNLVSSQVVSPHSEGTQALLARMRSWALDVLAGERHGPGLYQVGFGAQHECGYGDNELATQYVFWDGERELQLQAPDPAQTT